MKCEFKKWIKPFGSFTYEELFECDKEATVNINGKHYCRHHSKLGRYVIREGDVGEIIFRCDTESQLRTEFTSGKYSSDKYRMQKISKSHRRDIV